MKLTYFLALLLAASVSFAAVLPSAVPIKGGVLDVKLARYDPVPAESGKLATLWLDVQNVGIEKVSNATFVLVPEYPFSLPNNDPQRNYGGITGLDDIRLEYKVLVDKKASEGVYKMKLKYSTEGRLFSEKEFSITVGKEKDYADLKTLFVKADSAFPGGRSRLTVDIINTDKGTAYYTLVKARSDAAVIERDAVFVGTLEANDFDTVDFDMIISGVEAGMYPVNIEIAYKDGDSAEIVQNSTVYIRVGSLDEQKALGKKEVPLWMYAVYIVVFIVAIRLLPSFARWLVKPFKNRKAV